MDIEYVVPKVAADTREMFSVTWSDDYAMFELMGDRRKIDHDHVDDLVESMETHGFLPSFPILVTKGGVIWDGNHRLAAAEQLGIPFAYQIVEPMGGLDQAIILADTTKRWTKADYLHRYCVQGLPEYLALREFWQEHPYLTLVTAIGLCHYGGHDKGVFGKGFIRGEYECNDVEFANAVCELAEYCGEHDVEPWSDRRFLIALRNLMSNPDFDVERFKERVAKDGYRIARRARSSDYIDLISEIYNFRLRDENRVHLRFMRPNHPKYRSEGPYARK